MVNLLLKIFVKDYNDLGNPRVRERCGTFASIVGVVVNLILSGVKIAIGLLTYSTAIVADGLNNLSDSGTSVMSFIGFKLSARPADRDHPFGHSRIEYIASMVVSFLILLVGFETLMDSVSLIFGISEAKQPDFSTVSLIIIGLSVLLKLWLFCFYRKVGKKIDSSAILAAATDSLNDCISTTAVLISSIVIKLTDFYLLDGIVGLGVSIIILIAGIKILNETKNSLLGEAPVEDTVNAIKSIVSEYPEVLGMHDLMVHNYGPNHYIASLHAEVAGDSPELDIYYLHDVIDNIEKRINQELNILCTIHMDPIVTNDESVAIMRDAVVAKIKTIDQTINVHDFRVVVGNTHTNLIFDVELPFESGEDEKRLPAKIQSLITEMNPDYFCVITVDRV